MANSAFTQPDTSTFVAKALYDANTVLAADTDDTPAAVTMAASTILARLAAGNIKAASVAEIITLLQAYTVGGTDVAVADGGTGASTAAAARANLATNARRQLRQNAMGILDENFDRMLLTSAGAPATQTVYGALLGLKAGDSVTGVALTNSTSAAGTAPTMARAGIANAAGQILALSGNLGAAANFPAPITLLPFASAYTVLADGGYYAVYVVNGTWGTTQPTIGRGTTSPAIYNPLSGFAAPHFSWTGQTDLPIVGNSLTMTAAMAVSTWMAFYGTPVA